MASAAQCRAVSCSGVPLASMYRATASPAFATADFSGPRGQNRAPDMCISHENAPPANTSRNMCQWFRCPAGMAVPAAQVNANMYAPGGPTASALQTNVATTAISATTMTASQAVDETQEPRKTPTAMATATTATWIARLKYGRPLPYSEVKPPVVTNNPAATSPASQPISTGTPMHTAARNANGQRRLASRRANSARIPCAGGWGGGGIGAEVERGWDMATDYSPARAGTVCRFVVVKAPLPFTV